MKIRVSITVSKGCIIRNNGHLKAHSNCGSNCITAVTVCSSSGNVKLGVMVKSEGADIAVAMVKGSNDVATLKG